MTKKEYFEVLTSMKTYAHIWRKASFDEKALAKEIAEHNPQLANLLTRWAFVTDSVLDFVEAHSTSK